MDYFYVTPAQLNSQQGACHLCEVNGFHHFGKTIFPGHWRMLGMDAQKDKSLRRSCSQLKPGACAPGEAAKALPPPLHKDDQVKQESRTVQHTIDGLWELARRVVNTPEKVGEKFHQLRSQTSGSMPASDF